MMTMRKIDIARLEAAVPGVAVVQEIIGSGAPRDIRRLLAAQRVASTLDLA